MTTVYAVYNSQGCVGRCDARCHEATQPKCKCICGGRNHGVGLTQARENTKKISDVYIKENLAKPDERADLRVFRNEEQMLMFAD